MEQRSDRINVLLSDLTDDDRERVKNALRHIAEETFAIDVDHEPAEEQAAS